VQAALDSSVANQKCLILSQKLSGQIIGRVLAKQIFQGDEFRVLPNRFVPGGVAVVVDFGIAGVIEASIV
jgi:hypothetical protein